MWDSFWLALQEDVVTATHIFHVFHSGQSQPEVQYGCLSVSVAPKAKILLYILNSNKPFAFISTNGCELLSSKYPYSINFVY